MDDENYECEDDTDIEIDGIQIFVETAEGVEPSQELSFDLPSSTRSVTVPAAFLMPGKEYKFEILVIEGSGNRTIWEIEFAMGNPTCT